MPLFYLFSPVPNTPKNIGKNNSNIQNKTPVIPDVLEDLNFEKAMFIFRWHDYFLLLFVTAALPLLFENGYSAILF